MARRPRATVKQSESSDRHNYDEERETTALDKLVHYSPNRHQPVWQRIWGPRFLQLDQTCQNLYMTGLFNYQGWGFNEILEAEKNAGHMRQPNTLDKHLNHLRARDFVSKGPGYRGKYYFEQLAHVAENIEKLNKGIIDREFQWVVFLTSPSAKKGAAKAEELAMKLRIVNDDFGFEFSHLLRSLNLITKRRDVVRHADIETQSLRIETLSIAIVLLQNYRDVIPQGVRIFRKSLSNDPGPLR